MRIICLVSAAFLASGPVLADEASTPTPADLLRGLEGEWAGALRYRDYQSGAQFELPMSVSIEAGPDGHAMIQTARYVEGGDRPDVYIVSASAIDPATGLYETATFRGDRALEINRQSVALVEPAADLENWSLVFTERGEDDGRPADIRITLTRNGDELLSVKEVDDLADADETFVFRNDYVLTRIE